MLTVHYDSSDHLLNYRFDTLNENSQINFRNRVKYLLCLFKTISKSLMDNAVEVRDVCPRVSQFEGVLKIVKKFAQTCLQTT